METVTVIAQAKVLGLAPQEQATLERTPHVDAHIQSGYLTEVVAVEPADPDGDGDGDGDGEQAEGVEPPA